MSTNFDGTGVSPFGMKVGPEVLASTGKHIYVHHTGSALSNGINPRLPVIPTLDGAVGKCRANKGDVIILLPGHAETIATATALALDVAGITVVNMSQSNPAVFSLSATDSTIAISAANVRVLGFPIVKATINNVAAGITISAADVEINVETRDTSATVEFISPIVTTAAADRVKIKAKHVGFLAGAVGTRYIDLVGANTATIDVDYFGVSSVAVVNMRTTASDNVRVTGKFHNGTTSLTKNVVDSVGTSTWSVEGFDVVRGAAFNGSNNVAVSASDTSINESVASKSAATMVNGQTLFTISGGPIQIMALESICVTNNDATASTLQYSTTPTVGSAQTISGASASLANAAAGATVTLAGTALSTAALFNANGANLIANPGTVIAQAGTITAVVAVGSTTGTWKHVIRYKPLAVGVTVS